MRIAIALGLVASLVCEASAQPPTLMPLRPALRSNSADRQWAAVTLLDEGGIRTSDPDDIRQDLQDLIARTTDTELKAAAVRVLGKVPSSPKVAATVLEPYLRSSDVVIRRAGGDAVASAVQFGVASLDPRLVSASTPAVGLAGGTVVWLQFNYTFASYEEVARRLLPLVDRSLLDTDSQCRASGAESLRIIGQSIAGVLPDLSSIKDRDRLIGLGDTRQNWIAVLPTMQRLNESIPNLRAALADTEPKTRYRAVLTVRQIAQAKRVALINRNFDESNFEGIAAVVPRNPFQSGIQAILPSLVERLKDDGSNIRLAAMEAIEAVETDALPYVDAVSAATHDTNPFVRWVAARSLGKMVPVNSTDPNASKAVRSLAELLRDTDVDVQTAALTALAQTGIRGREAIDAVIYTVGHSDPEVSVQALRTLEIFKSEPSKVLPVLIQASQNTDPRVRKAAIGNLGRLGAAAKPALADLKLLLQDPDPEVRRLTGDAMLRIDQDR